MILSDFDLKNYIASKRIIIEPFASEIIRENGLDLRLGNQLARMKNVDMPFDIRRPNNINDYYVIESAESFIINPYEHVLTVTMEYLELPTDVMAFVELRSTFARLGLFIPPTIVDANFKGQLTIELIGGPFPVKLYAGERFLHLIFAKLTSPVEKPYSGKYQGQRGVTLPKPDFHSNK
ncbi:MAG: dCTP deaminase [Thermoprotei archaeon]|jgi:dCTP deaminase